MYCESKYSPYICLTDYFDIRDMSRGGARNYPKGSGKRETLVCRVDPETMAQIRQLAEDCGMSRGEVIDHVIKWYAEDSEKEG